MKLLLIAATLLASAIIRPCVCAGDDPPPAEAPVGRKQVAQDPDTSAPLTRIMFGSCIKQNQPAPILQQVVKDRPQLFLFLGDNIYADTTDMDVMRQKYEQLDRMSGFQSLRKTCPILATWDDHDFGSNDAGADYGPKRESQRIFVDFWRDPADSPRRKRRGIYMARVFGPAGHRVQVIVLDTRYFRGNLDRGQQRRVGGPYVPTGDTTRTMLGDAQWSWLAQQLKLPAELRLVLSSIQFVAEAAGQETWSNLPHERTRLLALIQATGAKGVVFLSGDRHWAELSRTTEVVGYPIYDLTSSSLNQEHARGTPTDNRFRWQPMTFHRENYGVVAIDWKRANPRIDLQIRDQTGMKRLQHRISLSELQPRDR